MLNRGIAWALGNRWAVLVFAGAICIGGILAAMRLPIDAVPDITNTQVVINAKTGALDPEKIESWVTRPVELEMAGLPGLEDVRSISKFGLSQVTLVFEDGTDVYRARAQILERLQNIRNQLPGKVTPELAPVTTGLGEIVMYRLLGHDELPEEGRLMELRTIQDTIVRPQLKRIVGVADIDSNGGYVRQIHINFFPRLLEEHGLSADQLVERLNTVGESFGGGYIETQGRQVIVRTVPGFKNWKELEQIPLGLNVQGRPISLGQVAQVRPDHALRVGGATVGGAQAVLGTVLMRSGANSREVSRAVEEAIAGLALPPGVRIEVLYTRAQLVSATIRTVLSNLLEGAILVVVVLIALLGNLRAALLVTFAIPLSMAFAAFGMLAFGVSGNLMSLGAIDFGLLVDGSVVVVESFLRKRGALGAAELTDWMQKQAIRVMRPVAFGLVLIMLVYVPLLTLQGVEGKLFFPMALTVVMALAASLWVAWLAMPAFARIALSGAVLGDARETRVFKQMRQIYIPILRNALEHPRRVFGTVLILGAVAIAVALGRGSDFVPQLDEGDLVIGVTREPSVGIENALARQALVEKALMQLPEVERVFSRVGTPESATDPMGVHLADTFVILKRDHSQWRARDKREVYKNASALIEKVDPGVEVSETQPIEMRFNEILEGSRADVTLRIYGNDLDALVTRIDSAEALLQKVPGIESIGRDPLTALRRGPVLDLSPRFGEQARLGVSLSQFNRFVELAMSGQEVGGYFEGSRRLPIMVHLDESLRTQLSEIRALPLALPQGGTVALSRLADISEREAVTTIARNWGERYAALSIQLGSRDIGSFVNESKVLLEHELKLEPGERLYWGGQFKNLQRALGRLSWILPLTLLGVFLLLWRGTGNGFEAASIFVSIPLAAMGGIFALALRGIPFSVSAAVGFIALIGIAVLNALVMLETFHETKRAHLDWGVDQVIFEGCLVRLKPVLMTAWVAALGFIPMALSHGMGAEVQRPLATVVVGGLVTATTLTLVVLPLVVRALSVRGMALRDSHVADRGVS